MCSLFVYVFVFKSCVRYWILSELLSCRLSYFYTKIPFLILKHNFQRYTGYRIQIRNVTWLWSQIHTMSVSEQSHYQIWNRPSCSMVNHKKGNRTPNRLACCFCYGKWKFSASASPSFHNSSLCITPINAPPDAPTHPPPNRSPPQCFI